MQSKADRNRLSEKDYWNSLYVQSHESVTHSPSRVKRMIRLAVGNPQWMNGQIALHRTKIVDAFLPTNRHFKCLEVGCAPGHLLVSYNSRYGYEPWGIDYSEEGVKQTRRLLESRGLDASRAVKADFFSDEIIERFAGFFDVVTSHGFIEHFNDVLPLITRHVELLRPGGLLLVQIPNLRWFNYFRCKFCHPHPDRLAMHNLAIMRLSAFRSAFEHCGLEHGFVGYVGTATLRHVFPSWMPDIDSWVDKLLALCLKSHALTSRFFSPYLMYIGTKL